jgi:hypothetical protein
MSRSAQMSPPPRLPLVGLADLGARVPAAELPGPPSAELLAESRAADDTEAVVLGEVFDSDDGGQG